MRGKGGKGRTGALAAAMMLTLVLGAVAPGACRAAKERLPLPGKVYTWSFQADTLGQKPAHSVAFGGSWQVVEDSTRPAHAAVLEYTPPDAPRAAVDSLIASTVPAPRFLSQTESDDGISFHYLNFTRPMLGDLDASVRFRIRSG